MILKDPFGCSVEPGLRVRVGVRMGAKVGADGPWRRLFLPPG